MFGKKIHLFSLFGFKVGVDLSWLLLAVLITWSLAAVLFPQRFEGYSQAAYWWMGIAGALGLFGSIIFHEFCHSIVARRFGLPMKGITLFIFGGVAEMEDEPESPKAEFFMAAAGPLSSILLAGIVYLIYTVGTTAGWPGPVTAVLWYLSLLNSILAGFNLIPAFPLDGGRILRSILWRIKGSLRWSTRVASGFGSGFGIFLIVLGIVSFIGGAFVPGIWWFLIGMFIRSASQMSYQRVLTRKALAGEPTSRFMKEDPVTVPPSASVEQLVNDYFYKYHYKMFPVSQDGRLSGCVTAKQVKGLPREQWNQRSVRDVAQPCSDENTVDAHTDAMKALSLMNRTGNSRLMVVDGQRLVGVITLKDMLKFLSLKMDLEEEHD